MLVPGPPFRAAALPFRLIFPQVVKELKKFW